MKNNLSFLLEVDIPFGMDTGVSGFASFGLLASQLVLIGFLIYGGTILWDVMINKQDANLTRGIMMIASASIMLTFIYFFVGA